MHLKKNNSLYALQLALKYSRYWRIADCTVLRIPTFSVSHPAEKVRVHLYRVFNLYVPMSTRNTNLMPLVVCNRGQKLIPKEEEKGRNVENFYPA